MGNCFGQEEEITTTVPYKEKYDAKFNALDINDRNESAAYNNDFIMEYVKEYGNIIMKYDDSEGTFFYYSDRHISNEALETVSKKYALQFHCKHIYRDNNKEKDKEKDKEMDKEKEETDETREIPNVYGKFKERQKMAQKRQEKTESKINNYIYLGKVRDFQIIQPVQHKRTIKKMTYSEFKKSGSLRIDV